MNPDALARDERVRRLLAQLTRLALAQREALARFEGPEASAAGDELALLLPECRQVLAELARRADSAGVELASAFRRLRSELQTNRALAESGLAAADRMAGLINGAGQERQQSRFVGVA